MKSSGNTRRSAPSAAALTRAARTLAALPSTSPTVGFSWASVILNSAVRSLMTYAHFVYKYDTPRPLRQSPSSDRAYALGDGKQPEQGANNERNPHRRRAQILDAADLRIVSRRQAVGKL